jgi:hypothetical protein
LIPEIIEFEILKMSILPDLKSIPWYQPKWVYFYIIEDMENEKSIHLKPGTH